MNSIYTDRDNLRWRDDDSILGIIWQYEGEVMFHNITVEGSSPPSNVSAVVYRNGVDVTAVVMNPNNGLILINGQVITLRALTFLLDNCDYSVIVTATIAGITQERKLIVHCLDRRSSLSRESNYADRRQIIWRIEQPELGIVFQFPSETVTYSITIEGSYVPVIAVNAAAVYKDGSGIDISDTVMPSGSHTVSGRVITLKPLTGLVSRSSYSVMVKAFFEGDTRKSKLIVKCVDPQAT